MDVFPSNTLAEYQVYLPQPIQLTGDWEVALTEIQYPHSWNNVHSKNSNNHFYIYDQKDVPTVYIVQSGYYSTVEELLRALKKGMTDKVVRDSVNFTYNKVSRRVTIDIKNGYKIYFTKALASILGFKPDTFISKQTRAENTADLERTMHFLYVYSDVVQSQIVGNSQVPLIRIVPAEGKEGDHITTRFTSPQYLPVSKKQFETIEIDIKRDTGEKVPFEFGRVLVTLHFRRASPYFN